ncbi:tetratricopeptide repeat protein [Lentzea sp. NBC_00516]|uniref:tetratricopeptide repeat protein n=1 Tax=Lentzea sp. NBC_00516 TaxID=2903582 RepID=UPI002E80A333|nr:tetratricopeptide repeat protein [Lentzea sp. NBC_00516]WUD21309.1 tetratricopeptide repeat protein [Lentzea sp. NBC_00516]
MRARAEVPVMVIEGAAGMGKSSLVLRWAHDHASEFPGGQLFADLGGEPGAPALAVLHGFLRALGMEPAALPQEVGTASAAYRSVLAQRSVLVVLENVANAGQVLPFIPGTGTSALVVTSRARLTGPDMNGVSALHLGELAEAEAARLLRAYLGEVAERESVEVLVDRCAGLPLALAIVAARAAEEQDLPSLAAEFDDADDELDVFDSADGDNRLRAVFTWAYTSLSEADARVLRVLGTSPATELTAASVASLLAVRGVAATRHLRRLTSRNLLTQRSRHRFHMHPLVRSFARQMCVATDESGDIMNATRRLVDFYTHTARAADRMLYPNRSAVLLSAPAEGSDPLTFDGEDDAVRWLGVEYRELRAALDEAVHGSWHEQAWHLARSLDTYHYRSGRLAENVETSRVGVIAAVALDDTVWTAIALRQLGRAYTRVGDFDEASQCLRRSLASIGEDGDDAELGHVHHDLARLAARSGDHAAALRHSSEALRRYREARNAIGESHALNALGRAQGELGDDEAAIRSCAESLALSEKLGNRSGRVVALDNLGVLSRRTGAFDQAVAHFSEAVRLAAEQEDRFFEAEVTERLGLVLASRGDAGAAEVLRRARDLFSSQHRTVEAQRCDAALGG